MPRVNFVKAARKDNPVAKKGEPYYWWKFRYGGKRFSLTHPKPSQLTQSAYLSTVYTIQEQIEAWDTITNEDDLEMFKDEIRNQLEELRDQTQESLDNMPESLQYSQTGELLQERIDALESAMDDIDNMDESSYNWSEVATQKEEHTEWEGNQPERENYDSAEAYADDLDEWECEEPEIDELEEADLSEAVDAVSNAII
jgi:hypothetical protein